MRRNDKPKKERPDTELIPKTEFDKTVKMLLEVSKEESDQQMESFQGSNKKRREQRRRLDSR